MSRRSAPLVVCVAASALLTALGVAFFALSWNARLPDAWGFRGFTVIYAVSGTFVGAAIARRRANRIAWLLLLLGLEAALQFAFEQYAIFAIVGRAEPLRGGVLVAWLNAWIWVSGVALSAVYVPLLFPDGRLLSAGWRLVAVVTAVSTAWAMSGFALSAGPLENATFVENPVALLDVRTGRLVYGTGMLALVACIALAAGSIVLRYRRAGPVERQQLKWIAFAAAFAALAFGSSIALLDKKVPQVVFTFALAFVIVAIGIAILRYRLYEIDVLINRALVYGATTAAIAIAFFAVVLVVQGALSPFTRGNELAIAVSTLISLALFQPLRRQVQAAVDRRFYRSRYDAGRTIDAFAARLRDQIDLASLEHELLSAVGETVQPAQAGLWLRRIEHRSARNDSRTPVA